ncbi:hypothetical protein ABE527_02280 [Brucella sp. TWI432]
MSDLSSFLSTKRTAWSAAVWDGFIEAVAARLAPLEEQLNIQKEVTDAIIARGLTVIEQELAPIVQQADQILDESTESITLKLARFEQKVTGGTVICVSNTSATLANAATLNLNVVAADREFFAPTPYLALSRASTVANWAIAKVKSFNRSTGALSITLEQITGPGGPYTDWIITSLPGATLLQIAYYEQTLALSEQVSSDKKVTGEDRAAVAVNRAASETAAEISVGARQGAETAYANLRDAIAEPLVPPTNPVVGQLWWDGSITRVYDGIGYVPTVTTSIGGRRFEQGIFGPQPDGVITVGGGFTSALVFINGALISENDDYTQNSPIITINNPQQGDKYFVEAYLSTDATDYDTKEQVDHKVSTAFNAVPKPTTATVGAAVAGANGKQTPADGDFFAGVEAGSSTMFKSTWANIKATLKAYFDPIYQKALDFTPVRQFNGGVVSIGWGSGLELNVDATWFGNNWPVSISGRANGGANWADGANYANTLGAGGWNLATIQDQLNWRVSDTRFDGYLQQEMRTTGSATSPITGASGYVVTAVSKRNVEVLDIYSRQPQRYIPNQGWRALGGW